MLMQISDKLLKLASKGDILAVKRLLNDEPHRLNATSDGHNRTLLWEAARMGRLEMVRFLIESGANPNIAGRYRAETLLLVKPYCIALIKKRIEVATYLLHKGTTIDGYTAAFLGQMDILEKLLGVSPMLIHQQQPGEVIWSVTLLHHAIAGEQIEVTKYLIKAGAHVSDHAPLLFDIACRRKRLDLIEILVEAGAKPNQAEAFSVIRSDSQEIMDYFFRRGCALDGVLVYVCRGDKGENPNRVKSLLEYGATVNEVDDKGRTPLHNAARAGFTEVIKLLLSAGANVNIRMENDATPLALAVKKKRQAAIEILQAHGGVL